MQHINNNACVSLRNVEERDKRAQLTEKRILSYPNTDSNCHRGGPSPLVRQHTRILSSGAKTFYQSHHATVPRGVIMLDSTEWAG